jgi:hypothetical protein
MKRKHRTRAQLIRNTLRSLMRSLKTTGRGRVVRGALPRPPLDEDEGPLRPRPGKVRD